MVLGASDAPFFIIFFFLSFQTTVVSLSVARAAALFSTTEAANGSARLRVVSALPPPQSMRPAYAGGSYNDAVRAERKRRPVSPRRPPPSSPLTRTALLAVSKKLRAAELYARTSVRVVRTVRCSRRLPYIWVTGPMRARFHFKMGAE